VNLWPELFDDAEAEAEHAQGDDQDKQAFHASHPRRQRLKKASREC